MFGDLFADDDVPRGRVRPRARGSRLDTTPPAPRPRHGFCGLVNQGATCYLNCLLQTLYMTPEFRHGLFTLTAEELGYQSNEEQNTTKARVIPIQLQRLFSRLMLLDQDQTDTTPLTDSFGWRNSEELQQHDVQELNRILFGAIEESLYGTSGQDLINQLYHGTFVNKTVCQECQTCSDREEDFLDLSVAVAGNLGLENSLYGSYVQTERLDGKNQYRCTYCDKLVNAVRSAKIRRLPAILTISLLRFSFDFARMERYKETGRFSFPLRLDMRQYHESESESESDTEYELYSVIIHRGSAHGGHYHAYIRDVMSDGTWSEPINDEMVALPRKQADDNVDVLGMETPQNLIEAVLLKIKSASMDQLCSEIAKMTGISWNKRYKSKYGPISKFLKRFEEKFIVHDGIVTVRDTGFVNGSTNHNDINSRDAIADDVGGSRWFDFDDGKIRPIRAADIEMQFSGRESSYMLMYRRRNLQATKTAVPVHLTAEVDKINAKLHESWAEYDRVTNQTTFIVVRPSQCYLGNGMIQIDETKTLQKIVLDRRKKSEVLFEHLKLQDGADVVVHVGKRLPAGLHLYHQIVSSNQQSLNDFVTEPEVRIFAWNGSDIHGSKYPVGAAHDPIVLAFDNGVTSVQRPFFGSSVMAEVLEAVWGPGVGCGALRIRKADTTSDTRPLPVPDVTKTLRELALEDYDQLILTNESGDATKHGKLILLVETRLTGVKVESHSELSVAAVPDSTIETLRSDIARLLTLSEESTCKCRLRIDDDFCGLQTPLRLETSLKSHKLVTGARIVIEEGLAPTPSQIALTFKLNGQPTRSLECNVEKSWSVRKCTQEVLTSFGLESDDWFLVMTSWCGETDTVLSDWDALIGGCQGLHDGAVLLLQREAATPQGYLVLSIWLYPTVVMDDGCVQGWLQHTKTDEEKNDVYCPPDVGQATLELVSYCGDVHLPKSATTQELKLQLMTLPLLQDMVIPSPRFIRVRKIEQGYITSVLRSKEQQTLSRQKVVSNGSLLVQILHEEEDLGVNDILVNVTLHGRSSLTHPATELCLHLDTVNTVHRLMSRVCEHVGVEVSQCSIAKHLRDKYEWLPIKITKPPGNPNTKKNKQGSARNRVNFRGSPYFLKDGDVICVKNIVDTDGPADDFNTADDLAGKDRLRRQAEDKRRRRRERQKSTSAPDWQDTTPEKKEHTLNIHVENFRVT